MDVQRTDQPLRNSHREEGHVVGDDNLITADNRLTQVCNVMGASHTVNAVWQIMITSDPHNNNTADL